MALTSPLTTLSTLSPPASFYTARHSVVPRSEDNGEADTTTITTPDDDEDGNIDDGLNEAPPYRNAIEPPLELKHGIQIHLEEQLYSQAIALLEGLLSDGSGSHNSKSQSQSPSPSPSTSAARIASPSQIAFLSTMAIHPHFTSRPSEGGRRRDGTHALAYLRGLVTTVGPINANFKQAFSFHSKNSVRAAAKRKAGRPPTRAKPASAVEDDSGNSSGWGGGSDSDSVSCPFARDELVWLRAENFWSVLGWSFRCAAVHPARWKYWMPWLDLVVGVLEKDWDGRLRIDLESNDEKGMSYSSLRESILVAWLQDLRKDRKNVLKDVMKALLAFTIDDSGDKAIFKEVFEREMVVGPRKLKKRKAGMALLDLENDVWADYMDVEESESEEEQGNRLPVTSGTTGRRGRGRGKASEDGGAAAAFRLTDGIAQSIPIRWRLFRLLSAAAEYLHDMSFFSTRDLYQAFSDQVRNLPLPLFTLFVAANDDLPDIVQVSFYRSMAEGLLPSNRPDPGDVDPKTNNDNGFSAEIMRQCFLPFAASRVTAEDNAKLSIVLENIMWYLTLEADIPETSGIQEAIAVGINARENKIKKRGAAASKANGPDKLARESLQRSSGNLRLFASMLGDECDDEDDDY